MERRSAHGKPSWPALKIGQPGVSSRKRAVKRGIALLYTAAATAVVAIVLAWVVSRSAGDPLVQARQMLAHGDLSGAGSELRKVLRANPANAEARFRLAELGLAQGDVVAAERDARIAREAGYDPGLTDVIIAKALLGQGRYEEVASEFKPDGLPAARAVPLLVVRAFAQLAQGDLAAAAASVAAGRRLAPDDLGLRLAAANIAVARHDDAAAQDEIDRALKVAPTFVDALLLKGRIAKSRGDQDAAAAALTAALGIAPSSKPARLERAHAYLLSNKDDDARADVNDVLRVDPQNAVARYLRAVLDVRAKDFKAANRDLERISSSIDAIPRGLYFLAVTKAALGQSAQAFEAAERYAVHNPSDRDGLKLVASIDLAAGRPDSVIHALGPSAGAATDAETLNLLARAYALQGDASQAARTLERASGLEPQDASILTALASSRLRLGDSAGAAAALERSLHTAPEPIKAVLALADLAPRNSGLDQAQAALDTLHARVGDTEAVLDLAALIRLKRLDPAGADRQLTAAIERFAPAAAIEPRPDPGPLP